MRAGFRLESWSSGGRVGHAPVLVMQIGLALATVTAIGSAPSAGQEPQKEPVPAGAEIWVNGQKYARLTPTTVHLTPGTHKLRLHLEGYEDRTNEITVEDEEFKTWKFTFGDPKK